MRAMSLSGLKRLSSEMVMICFLAVFTTLISAMGAFVTFHLQALTSHRYTHCMSCSWLQCCYLTFPIAVGLHFSPRLSEPVALHIDGSAHYALDAVDSDKEWSSLLPSGGHVVHISRESGSVEKHTVTLFHQMRCLDVIRHEYNAATGRPSPLVKHCMSYLHQMLLCQLNPSLESTKNVLGSVERSYNAVCRDWTALYDEAERNYASYIAYTGESFHST